MKNYNQRFLLMLVLTLTLFSCVRNNLDFTTDATINDIVVPGSFDWSTLSAAELTVITADAYQAQYYYLVEIFGENPVLNSSAVLLAKGVANSSRNYVANLIFPSAASTIFVRQTDPLQRKIVQSVSLSSANLICDFNASSSNSSAPSFAMPVMASEVSKRLAAVGLDPDPTPTTNVIMLSASSNEVTSTNSKNYVIPNGVTYTKQITLGSGSCLYVEGTYNLASKKNFVMSTSGSKLVIQSGGSVNITNDKSQQYDDAQIKNFGSLNFGSVYTMTGTTKLYNAGTMNFVNLSATNTCEIHNYGIFGSTNSVGLTASATLYNYSGGTINFATFTTGNNTNTVTNEGNFTALNITVKSAPFTNTGSLTVVNTLKLTAPGTFSNSGAVVTKDLTTESTTKIYNNCHIVVTNATSVPGTTIYLYEGSLFKTKFLAGDGTTFEMDKGSILEAEIATFTTWRNYIKGVGTDYALARLASVAPRDNRSLSSNITYQGKVEIECTTHTQNQCYDIFYVVVGSDVRWAATGASTTVIASTACNAGGNNESIPGDDDPPTDPPFPIIVPLATNYSFIMEDNWPYLGDYDMNDLVVDLSISYLQNAENKAEKMIVAYKLRAVGANYRIAAAFQLDKVLPGQISSVSYYTPVLTGGVFSTEKGGLETGQSKAVIPLFDDAHSLLEPASTASNILNTIIENTYFTPVSDTITIVFGTPVDPSDISIADLNFFIVTNGSAASAQRTEVHLSGFEPTDKVDVSKFGTGDDASIGFTKYRTANNLIWGLLIPTSFNYAVELKDITAAYPQFAGWCTSGGSENAFWYEFPTDKINYIYPAQ